MPNTPSKVAAENEERALMHLAIELLDDQSRWLVEQHLFQGRPYAEIAAEQGTSSEAVRKRLNRLLAKMAGFVRRLRQGEIGSLLGETRAGDC